MHWSLLRQCLVDEHALAYQQEVLQASGIGRLAAQAMYYSKTSTEQEDSLDCARAGKART